MIGNSTKANEEEFLAHTMDSHFNRRLCMGLHRNRILMSMMHKHPLKKFEFSLFIVCETE